MRFQSRRGTPPPARAGRCLTESFVALDQPLAQPAFPPEPALEAQHPAGVAFVVIPHQMEKTVQREHAPLGQLRMAGLSSLTPRHAARDDDISQELAARLPPRRSRTGTRCSVPGTRYWVLGAWKTEHVGR